MGVRERDSPLLAGLGWDAGSGAALKRAGWEVTPGLVGQAPCFGEYSGHAEPRGGMSRQWVSRQAWRCFLLAAEGLWAVSKEGV